MSGPDKGRDQLKTTSDKPSAELSEDSLEVCPECEAQTLIKSQDESEIICEECGLVIEEDKMDRGPEWRAFNSAEQDRKSRVGAPTTPAMHDRGLTTQISWQNADASGNTLSERKQAQINRLRKWQERIRTRDSGERNLKFALSELNRMASAVGVPRSVREVAAIMYRRAQEEDLIRGRSIEAVASGCLYAACRQENLPRSLEEIEEVSRVEKIEIGRAYRYVAAELNLALAPVDPEQYLPRYISKLDLDEGVKAQAETIIEVCRDQGLLAGKSPTGFAAAAIYAASLLCDEKRTQQEVAEVANVTEVTIRNRYQEQLQGMEES